MRFFLIFLLLPLQLFSQELEGVWTGTIYNDTTRKYIPYEIAITESKGKITGYSHTVFTDENSRQETGVKSLKIKKKGDKILIEDDELIYNNYITPPPKGVRQYSVLSITNGPEGQFLVGVFNTNRTREYASLTGSINLRKKEKVTETSLIPVLEELKLANSLSFVQAKKTEEQIVAVLTPPSKEKQTSTQPSQQKEVPVVPAPNIQTSAPPLQQRDDIAKSETKKQPIKIEKDEKLIDIDEDTVDYKVDIVEIVTVTKPAKQPKETVKTPTVILPKTQPLPEPAKQTVKVEEKKPPVIQPKKDIVVVPVKEEKKPQSIPEQKVTAVIPKPVVQQQKQVETKPAEVKKDVATVPKEEKPKPLVIKPVQNLATTGPVISSEELARRKIETIRSVDVKADSIILTLYDNGVIDGDSVSVILNGKTIMSRQRLTETALNKTIYMTPELGDSLQLIMFAENLGSIAPNTGLLIIQDGRERHEVRFSGDLQKNSAIILRRKRN